MIYLFEDVETGGPVDIEMDVADAVDFGAEIEVDGRRYRRVVVAPQLAPVTYLNVVGWRRSPGVPGADGYMDPITGKITREDKTGDGVPMWDSKGSLQRTEKLTEGRETFDQLK